MNRLLEPITMMIEKAPEMPDLSVLDDNSPRIKTYGSTKVIKHTPAQWKKLKEQPKISRNEPCPCGSGKKYKKCCLIA